MHSTANSKSFTFLNSTTVIAVVFVVTVRGSLINPKAVTHLDLGDITSASCRALSDDSSGLALRVG